MATTTLRELDHATPPTANADSAQHIPDCLTPYRRIASNCWQAIESNREAAIAGNPEAVHRMRIELARLRAAARFFATIAGDAEQVNIDRQLRWLNSALGTARDRDVVVEYANRKRYRRRATHSRRTLLRSQRKTHRRLATKLDSARYRELAFELHHWILNRSAPDRRQAQDFGQLGTYCDRRLSEWRDEICRQGRRVRKLHRKPLHQLRILSKQYRYVVEALLDQDIPIRSEDFIFCESASCIHRTLGELRDLKLLGEAIGRSLPHYRKHKRKLIQRVEDLLGRHP